MEVIGHREAAGRPALYATTRQFLDDLGLQSLDQLPLLESVANQSGVFGALVESVDDSIMVPSSEDLLVSDATLQLDIPLETTNSQTHPPLNGYSE